ncbi:MAG: FG-GAP-like repeat-containing protein, partial [Candidatus Eremiobacterota bacterium]
MRSFLKILVLGFLGLGAVACSEQGLVSGPPVPLPQPAPTTATLVVRHVLLRAVPANVSDFRFTGRDASGAVVFGPDTRPKAAEITLTVPLTMSRLTIEYLQGNTLVGVFTADVQLSPGGSLVIQDPSWVDVQNLLGLAVNPPNATIAAGTAQSFTATGTFSDGSTQDLTLAVNWTSSDPAVAGVDPQGSARGLAPGNSSILAALGSVTGTASLTVTDATLVSLAVTPTDPGALACASTLQFTATGTFSNASTQNLTSQVTWTSSNPAASLIDTNGLATTVLPGVTTIGAAMTGVNASTTLTVTASPIPLLGGPRGWPVGTGPHSIATADFNGDGRADLATVDRTASTVSVLLGGAAGFAAAPGSPIVATSPRALVAGDFNGDGRPDLAVTSSFVLSAVSILLGDGTGGFAFAGPPVPVGGFTPDALARGDFNGDGRLDVVTANFNSSNVSVLLGDGAGGLAPATGSPFATGSGGVRGVAVADFNGDGRIDAATVNATGTVSVLLGDGAGGLAPAAGSPFFAVGAQCVSIAVGDLNGDSRPDVATSNVNGSNTVNSVSVLLGDGTGALAPAAGSPIAVGGIRPVAVATADFNGDGRTDLVTANQNSRDASVLLGDGMGGFTVNRTPAGDSPRAVAAGDFDGDGRTDLATANFNSNNVSVLPGDGAGGFGAVTLGARPLSVALADLNGDGRTDAAIANFNDSTVSVLLSDGAGGFNAAAGSPLGLGAGAGPAAVASGDFNGDGRADLATANFSANTVSVLLGAGTGAFAPATGSPVPVGAGPQSLATGDLDGDGRLDLVTANSFSANVTVLLGDGAGGFAPGPGSPLGLGTAPASVAVGDLNADGRSDLVTA